MILSKKYLGQHFLINEKISKKIANSLTPNYNQHILEIGPGRGALTYFLVEKKYNLQVVEIDIDCVNLLRKKYQGLKIIQGDFLKIDLKKILTPNHIIIGNFPYNISSQIVFKIIEHRQELKQVVGMFQKEVADRICSKPKSKKYGILSVLTQAYFKCETLFDVSPNNFQPPPNVNSSVIQLYRNNTIELTCNHNNFVKVVKAGFSQRRKKLKNALKKITNLKNSNSNILFSKRAEELNVSEFVQLTNLIFSNS